MMEKNEGVKLSLTMNDRTVTFESPHWDLGGDELVEAFYGLMVAQTFLPGTVTGCMRDFVEEHTMKDEE